MAIDYTGIRNKFISITRAAVGSSLSTIGPVGGEIPAVIRRRADGPKPDYPFIDLDILDTADEGSWESNHGVDDNGDLFWETHKQILITLKCYGGDAMDIMNDLHGYLRQAHLVQDDLRSTLSGSLVAVDNVRLTPIRLTDKFIDGAEINLVFNVVDRITDTTTVGGEITSITALGELFRAEDDPAPLPVTITAP